MLTIACVLKVGVWKNSSKTVEYLPEHVGRLVEQVKPHLTVPYRFVCLSDVDVPCERIPLIHNWPGWWSKIELFRPSLFEGPVLYIDIDTSIVGNIDHMVQHEDFTVLMNLSSKKRDRIGSGLMFWRGDHSYLYELFKLDPVRHMSTYVVSHRWGDQGFLQEHLRGWVFWQDLFPNQVRSYKLDPAHPEDRVLCFHGKPKPWEVNS